MLCGKGTILRSGKQRSNGSGERMTDACQPVKSSSHESRIQGEQANRCFLPRRQAEIRGANLPHDESGTALGLVSSAAQQASEAAASSPGKKTVLLPLIPTGIGSVALFHAQ